MDEQADAWMTQGPHQKVYTDNLEVAKRWDADKRVVWDLYHAPVGAETFAALLSEIHDGLTKPCAKDGRHGPGFVVIKASVARAVVGTNVGAEETTAEKSA